MLGPWSYHITHAASKKYSCPNANGLVKGIIKKGAKLSCSAVIGISHSWFQCPHVGKDRFVGEVNGAVVILIAVSGVT